MPPSPPARERMLSARGRARASIRASAAASREAEARRAGARVSSGGAKGATKARTPVPASGLEALIACLGVGPNIAPRILPVYQRRRRPALPAASAGFHSGVQKIGSLCRPTVHAAGLLALSFG